MNPDYFRDKTVYSPAEPTLRTLIPNPVVAEVVSRSGRVYRLGHNLSFPDGKAPQINSIRLTNDGIAHYFLVDCGGGYSVRVLDPTDVVYVPAKI